MIRAADARRVGLQEAPKQAQVRASPPAAALTVVIAGAAPLALPTPLLRALARTDRDDDRLALIVELDAVDHGRLLDPEHACPYRGVAHAVLRSTFRTFDSPEPRQGRRVARSSGQRPPTETTGEPRKHADLSAFSQRMLMQCHDLYSCSASMSSAAFSVCARTRGACWWPSCGSVGTLAQEQSPGPSWSRL